MRPPESLITMLLEKFKDNFTLLMITGEFAVGMSNSG